MNDEPDFTDIHLAALSALESDYPVPGVPHSAGDQYLALPVWVTPEMASIWMRDHNINNRDQKPHVIAQYRKAQEDGTWLRDGNTMAFDTNMRMINGQNRCMAIIQSGIPMLTLVAVNCDPAGFATTDTQAARNPKDILTILNPGGKHHSAMGSLANFIWAYENNLLLARMSMTNTQLVEMYLRRGDEMLRACENAQRAYGYVRGSKKALASAFWLIERVDPVAAREFYRAWTEAIGLREHDPAQTLMRTWGTLKTDPVNRTALIVKAYNFWATNKSIKVLSWKRGIERFPVPMIRNQ